jgi:hypothetical protein
MTDKIAFTIGGEQHDLPIDSSKTLRVGDISPDTKLTLTASKMTVTGSFIPPTKIVFNSDNGPAMTIHPDGRITLGENAQPTEAAAECINAMSHMIQSMIDRAVAVENERLRGLLSRTIVMAETYAEGTGTQFNEAMAEARAALGETK